MRQIYLAAALVLAAFTTNAQNFFLEDFDNCVIPDDWTSTIVTGDDGWQFGDNAAGDPGGSVDGTCMAFFHDDDLTSAAAFSTVDLTSPVIDLSSLDTGLLQFDYVFEDLGTSFFAVALWNGAAWDTVLTENTDPGCLGFYPTCGPRSASIDLTGYLNADFQMNFIYDDGDGWNWYIGLDNVAIYVPPTADAVATEALVPESACGLSATEMISLIVFNNGQSDITTIDAGFEVGAQTASETFTITIPVGESDTLNFVTPVDMSTPGAYDFAIWSELSGDEDASNDTVWVTRENIPVISSLPYNEGFESGSGFWNAGGPVSTWELGAPSNSIISEANNGVNAWVTNLTGDYDGSEDSYVESPCFDFSALTVDPVFRFAHIFDTEDCCDEGFVDISIDGGTNWTRLGLAGQGVNWYDDGGSNWWDGDGANGAGSMWRTAEHVLDGTAGESTVRIRIYFSGDGSINGEGFGFDDIEIFEFPTVNAGVTEILAPMSGCGLGSSDVTVVIENTGLDYAVDFDIAYDAGSGAVSQTITDTLFVGGIDTVTFTTPADLSTVGDYNISAWTELTGDGDPGNDTSFTTVSNLPVITTLPYMEDFESGAGGWIAGGVESTWELGDPETAFIDTAASGINAWVTNLTGNYNLDEQSFVESPCFDFSTLTVDPVFRFAIIADSEPDWDGSYVEVSYDGGNTWNVLGNVGEGTNWYTNNAFSSTVPQGWDAPLGGADEWFTATHLIDSAAGESQVKLRVFMNSDDFLNGFNGFAFDDVQVFEQPSVNAGVTEILSPVTGCGLGNELVTVVIENFGDADLVDFNIEYNDGSGVVTQMLTDTLFSSEIDTITFTVPADLSVNGDYDFGAWTAVAGDGDLLNDSLFTSVTSAPVVSSLPYMTDFESGADGWYSTGENGTWELGSPNGVLIDTANSGVNAWVTNLDSLSYENNQLSYLISPCFDLSGLVIDPILEFAFISNSEPGWDGMWLEASTDAGASWSTVGNFGEGTNWYNNEDEHGANVDEDWWDGNTQDSTEWINAEHLLDGVAGSSDVIIRFVFDSDGSNFADWEGFGLDDISLTEQPPVNGELTSLDSPSSNCGLTATETVGVTVTNLGSIDMDSVMVGFVLDNGTVFTETFNDTLSPNESGTYTFSETIDLSAIGDYELDVWVFTIGDGDTSNDTLSTTITSIPTVLSFPYMIDFESGANGWSTDGSGVWELGEPETAFIDTANSGINAWVTVLNGQYPNLSGDTVYVESPCLDFTSLTDDPVLSFAGIFSTEACCDEGWVDISLDGGATWSKLGTAGEGENWYNDAIDDFWNGTSGDANVWVNAEHLLDGAAGQSNVKVRFNFSSDVSIASDGFGLDDISIREQAQLDLVAISVDGPFDGCSLEEEEVTMTFWNKGLMDVSGFDLGFIVDNGTAQTETYTATVNSGDTVTYTFSSELADLATVGMHSIDVFTALTGDEDMTSDSLFGYMVENFGSSTPLSQTSTQSVAIPDGDFDGATSEIFFCGLPELDGCLEIVNVTIDSLSHGWMQDVDLYLLSPAGDTLELSTDNGGSGDNMYNVVFTDTSSNDITLQADGIAAGYYAVEDSLGFAGLYDGQDPNGSWSLLAIDDEGIFAGTLLGWSMTFQDNSPTPMLAQGDTTICVTQVLTVGIDDMYDSYLWSTGNNTQEIDLFGDILGLGTTEVSVTVDEDGCTGTSNSFILTVDACAGIDELAGLTIDMYPNPTVGNVVLDIAGESNGFVLEIVDVNGKLVYTETIGEINSGLRRTIDLSNVANGLYFLKLDDGTSSTTRKLMKQ